MVAVSVIIPVYNAGKYLHQCLDSIRNQTLKDIEIICVNDGSTDNSLEILMSYAEKDERIIVITQENMSAGAARNKGIKIATGEYLSILDADDFFEENMLKKAYIKAKMQNADIIVYRSNRYDERIKDFTESNWTIKKQYLPNKDMFSHKDMSGIFNCFVGWTWDKLFRADFIRKNKVTFQNQKSINDLFFVYSALAKADTISIIDEILVHKRYNNSNSITTNYARAGTWKCFYQALIALKEQLKEWNLYEELRRDFVNYALFFTLWNLNKFQQSEEFDELYHFIKEVGLRKMDILNHGEAYFYEKTDFEKLNRVILMDADEYRQYEIVMGCDGTYLFPFEMVDSKANIILYGAGNVGRTYYRQIKYSGYCRIVAWVDYNYAEKRMGVVAPDIIFSSNYDFIVLAINDENVAKKIMQEFIEKGIEEKKIIWRCPEIGL